MIERSEVRWGTATIPYQVRRSDRRATVSIAVQASGDVVLTAPASTPIPRLDRVVLEKAPWIVERVRRKSDLPPPMQREFVSGETILYLGRHYRLRVVANGEAESTRLERGRLVVTIPSDLGEARRSDLVRRSVVGWYRERASDRFQAVVASWAERLCVSVPRVLVRDQPQRWGSCDPKGTLRLNWRIVQASPRLIDYVVAHELVHLRHRDHGPAFWATLGRVMPDYETRREDLRRLGPSLVW
jgi:predicted metal-dependent hydrolase